jgi:hypothetical protein
VLLPAHLRHKARIVLMGVRIVYSSEAFPASYPGGLAQGSMGLPLEGLGAPLTFLFILLQPYDSFQAPGSVRDLHRLILAGGNKSPGGVPGDPIWLRSITFLGTRRFAPGFLSW